MHWMAPATALLHSLCIFLHQ